jgi:hypothetical protein
VKQSNSQKLPPVVVGRRTSENPPARLLLPGGPEQRHFNPALARRMAYLAYGLHFPLDPAANIACTSAGVSTRLKISNSSMLPLKKLG